MLIMKYDWVLYLRCYLCFFSPCSFGGLFETKNSRKRQRMNKADIAADGCLLEFARNER
ncbi:hypothetical protein GCM10028778_20060 [Barrientosiimonas marina]